MIIRAITVTSKKVLDIYCVYFWNGMCLSMSSNPDSPQGVSMFGEYFGINDSDFELGEFNGEKMINFYELPHIIQAHIQKRIEGI
jgi:hypothetical protein